MSLESGYSCVENGALLKLCKMSRAAQSAFNALLAMSSTVDGTCWPSYATLARLCEMSVDTIKRGVKELLSSGLVKRTRRRARTNVFHLTSARPTFANGGFEDDRREALKKKGRGADMPPTPRGSSAPLEQDEGNNPPPVTLGGPADGRPRGTVGEGDSLRGSAASGGVDADPADAGAGAEVAAAPVIDEIGDESAGWCDRAAARRRASRLVPVEPKMTRQSVDELVAAACVVGEGEAVLAPSGSLPSRDGSALPLTPGAAERAVAGLLGPDSGHHGAYAASRVARLAGLGDLTDRMLARAAAEATDARGVGCTRLVALVCRELHTARLSARWARRIDERREARRLADEAPVGGRVACPA